MEFPIRVTDVMSSPVETVTADATAAEAAVRCREKSIGSLVVVDDERVAGIVTSDDFVRLLGETSDPEGRRLHEFMASEVVTVDADVSVGDAVRSMFDHGIARLVVVEGEEPVGLVSTDDVVHHLPQVLQRQEFERPRPEEFRYSVRQEVAYEEADWEVESVGLADDRINVGDRVAFAKTLDEEDVRRFAAASGDTNRLHLDEEYARGTRFGRRIAHGTLVGGLISAALARLPGLTIYVSQSLTFLAPVGIGDRMTAVCEVVEELGDCRYQITTDVVDGDDEPVIEGQAVVLVDDLPDVGSVRVEGVA
ncbi:CBS domain-containing protein [Natronorarus salvus]|uniref:CBS domain-containing protein n=1 Tax=Natronorarus salvus TaxID=3117733 RepID=UPI002F2632D4